MHDLTDRQLECLQLIADDLALGGRFPAQTQLARDLGITNKAVSDKVAVLIARGYLTRDYGAPWRTIRLTPKGRFVALPRVQHGVAV